MTTSENPAPNTPPVDPIIQPPQVVQASITTTKPFYTSKTFWLGILLTVIGISTYFTDPAHAVAPTLASVSEAIGGVGTIVLRLWFTNQPTTQYALKALQKK